MSPYTSVVLDFDGTLFDTRHAIAATLHETFAAHGMPSPAPHAIDAILARGASLEATLTHLLPHTEPAARLDAWIATYRRIYDSGTGIRASTPYPGSRSALAELSAAGVPVVIASNKGDVSVRRTLAHFDMHELVRLVIAARDASPTKPDPRSYFERIVPVLGTAACERVLVAGDTEVDLHYARSIGAASCWAAYGYGNAEDCRRLQPDVIAESPDQIAAAACSC